jgi:hypothetical protein
LRAYLNAAFFARTTRETHRHFIIGFVQREAPNAKSRREQLTKVVPSREHRRAGEQKVRKANNAEKVPL